MSSGEHEALLLSHEHPPPRIIIIEPKNAASPPEILCPASPTHTTPSKILDSPNRFVLPEQLSMASPWQCPYTEYELQQYAILTSWHTTNQGSPLGRPDTQCIINELQNQTGLSQTSIRSFFTATYIATSAETVFKPFQPIIKSEWNTEIIASKVHYVSNTSDNIENYSPLSSNLATESLVPDHTPHMRAADSEITSSVKLPQQPIKTVDFPAPLTTSTNTGEKLYTATNRGNTVHKCSICSKSLANRRNLSRHMSIHTGEGSVCTVCFKSFAYKESLNAHMRIHTGEKPYQCSTCMKSFTYHQSLSAHMPTHTDKKMFTCSICKQSFSQKQYLTRHARIHTDKKMFTCSICRKSFSQKRYLTKHAHIHTGAYQKLMQTQK